MGSIIGGSLGLAYIHPPQSCFVVMAYGRRCFVYGCIVCLELYIRCLAGLSVAVHCLMSAVV